MTDKPHTPTPDIVERLEDCRKFPVGPVVSGALSDAADEITRLRGSLDPAICRLQFPDGHVPGNIFECAEGWKACYDSLRALLTERDKIATAREQNLRNAHASHAELVAALRLIKTWCGKWKSLPSKEVAELVDAALAKQEQMTERNK
jgi:hypothetical protein